MSNFAARLDELMERATKGPCKVELDYLLTKDGAGRGEPMQDIVINGRNIARLTIYSKLADGDLIAYLVNHAPPSVTW